jgi:hypothetical protein
VKSGFAKDVRTAGEAKTADFNVPIVQKLYPLLSLRQRFRDLNSQKRD